MSAYQEIFVHRDQHRMYVREHRGEEPRITLMHGFPDNLRPTTAASLSPPRRAIAFDFLGWGASDKPYTASTQVDDLDAVITQLRIHQVILVAPDFSEMRRSKRDIYRFCINISIAHQALGKPSFV
jgi:pimeloyl-ACP methyl ester carboxylesterase